MVFAGCSFTHSGESWAYQPQPNNIPRVENMKPGDIDDEEHRGVWGRHLLTEQGDNYAKKYGVDKSIFEPDNFFKNSKPLSENDYEINIFGRGSNSNTDTARCIMHFIENYEYEIDTVVMQISGFSRRELFTSSQEVRDNAKILDYEHNVTQYDDATFIKHWGAIDYNEVLQEENPCPFRKASAYFYSAINEPEEYHIRAIEQLQSLTNFCKANNIKLGYFHGWDNKPRQAHMQDYEADYSNHTGIGTQYFEKKYNRYVKPHLLSQDSIISYAQKHLEEKFVYDLQRNGDHGGHPCPLAHQKYWNNIVYPFVV